MPVIGVTWWDLERLLGRDLSREEIEDSLPRVKCELEEIEGDTIWYEATHDRPDLYSAEGLSIALKGLLGVEEGLVRYNARDEGVSAVVEGPSYRPYALFAVVHGLRLDDEAIRQLMQLQEKVHITYGRDRRKVSIGLYDLRGIKFPVRYIAVKPEEARLVPLDMDEEMSLKEVLEKHPTGVKYRHLLEGRPEFPLIVDAEGKVVSFPPIINSEEFRVTEETRDVLIDVTSTDLEAARRVLAIVATAAYVRGEEIGIVTVKGPWGSEASPRVEPDAIDYNVELNEKLLGLSIGVEDTVRLLSKMRMEAEPRGDTLTVRFPYFRTDILHPVDIAEEVAMAYGYDRIEPLTMKPLHPGREAGIEVFTRSIRESMVGLGFTEVNNYMFTSTNLLFTKMGIQGEAIEVENPKHEAYHALRTWITPQLLQTLSSSKHAGYPLRIFEAGDVVIPDKDADNLSREERHLAYAVAGRGVTLTDGLAYLKALLNLYSMKYTLKPLQHPSLIPGRAASIHVGEAEIGFIGEVHPRVLTNFALTVPVVVAEIDLGALRKAYLSGREK